MRSFISKFVKRYPEHYVAQAISKIFWPPPTVSVLAYGEHGDILTLNIDESYRLPGGFLEKGENFKKLLPEKLKKKQVSKLKLENCLISATTKVEDPTFSFKLK